MMRTVAEAMIDSRAPSETAKMKHVVLSTAKRVLPLHPRSVVALNMIALGGALTDYRIEHCMAASKGQKARRSQFATE